MALFDDVNFIITHLRNSYITSDDTGICEIVIENEEYPDKPKEKRISDGYSKHRTLPAQYDSGCSTDGSDSEVSTSYDIVSDMDIGAHRRRSNTAQRLERIKVQKQRQSRIKHVQWKEGQEYNVEELGHLFEKVDFGKKDTDKAETRVRSTSALSRRLEKSSGIPNNLFHDYAKFDGKAHSGVATKAIDIFLTMVSDEERPYPMLVVTIATAKVQDLIGLICWQYTNEGRKPALSKNLELYSLYMAEDDGEVDYDFPSLDIREPISKFGFSKLALVQEKAVAKINKAAPVVTIYLPSKGFNKIQVESESILMKEILEKVLQKRKINTKGLSYLLEKQNEPGVAIDLDSPLSAMETLEFCLVREHSARGDQHMLSAPADASSAVFSLTSHQYKSYRVSMALKLGRNTEVHLGISGDKIEIDPVSSKASTRTLFQKQKPSNYNIEDVAACELIEEKSTGKSTFRLIYKSNLDQKHHDFEAESAKANEIIQHINTILELRSSLVRKEYMAMKQRKLNKSKRLPYSHSHWYSP
ncbi:target of rapamycin complex 2 subunit MAPKAP1 [Lingula anatina]|uniref:Target of rapamycin complex 2 subunit MAPKAP1 n=1 Tax=Lingula anatina TaxID=7574 RepID=A0A1S3J465_LINAN|nr:target of rapamycin complex 2 subunit MAPKAP1 [Lingula anatina]|eukprot:XP_013405227.1 target of rapamycin complex 2 subunit MAPKAP1 [Lingula anatina]